MTVDVKDEWEPRWSDFDAAFEIVLRQVRGAGASSAGVSALMRSLCDGAAMQDPAYVAWAAIRHGVTSYFQLRDRALELVDRESASATDGTV